MKILGNLKLRDATPTNDDALTREEIEALIASGGGGTGGGALEFVTEGTLASNQSSLDLDGVLDFTKYDSIKITVKNLVPATDDVEGRFRFRKSASDVTSGYTASSFYTEHDAATSGPLINSAGSYIIFGSNVSNTATEGIQLSTFELHKTEFGIEAHSNSTTRVTNGKAFLYERNIRIDDGDVDGLKLYFDAGDVQAGAEYAVWGIRKDNAADTDNLYNLPVALSAPDTDLATGLVETVHSGIPFTATDVMISVTTPATGSAIEVDIHKNGSTIFTTTITIDATENTSLTATTAYALIGGEVSFAQGDKIEYYIDAIGSTTAGQELKAWLIGEEV